MRIFAAAAVALAAASAAVAGSQAATERAAPLTATGIRIGNHPGFVRVVVDFSGGRVFGGEEVRASDPNPFPDGKVRLPLFRRGVRTTAAPVQEHGVSARVAQGSGRIVIRLDGVPRRFKYVGYFELHSPERLAIDLYRSAPPTPAAEIRRAPDGCLSLDRFDVGPRSVTASGTERHLFENTLVVRLRRGGGHIHEQRVETAAAERWSTQFRYPRTRRRTGTLEAVASSASDGTLDCLTQVRVRFGG